MTGALQILRVPEYPKYLLAALAASLGTGMYFVAVSWYLFSISGSTLAVGWSLVATSLPGLLLSPVVGYLVDRWNVRRVCAAVDLLRALTLAVMAFGMYTRQLTPVLIYAGSFLVALCDNFFQPAIGALTRDIVAKEQLLDANVASSMVVQVGTLAGAGLGGVAVALLGTHAVLGINAACFGVSAVLIFAIRYHPAPAEPAASARSESVMAGFRSALADVPQRRQLYTVVAQQVIAYLTVFVCNTLLPGFVARELHAGSQGFGLIDAAWGCGALFGGLLLGLLLKRGKPVVVGAGGLAIAGLGLAALGLSKGAPQAAAAYLLLGALGVMLRINGDTEIARVVSRERFGTFKSAVVMVVSWSSLLVYLGIGGLGDNVSVRAIYLAMSAVAVISGLVMLASTRERAAVSEVALPRPPLIFP